VPLGRAGIGRIVIAMLAIDEITRHAEWALAARIKGHGHHAVAHLDLAGLGHLHHLTGGLMAQVLAGRAGHKGLVLGAHGDGVHLDQCPITHRMGRGHIDDGSLTHAGDGNLFHGILRQQ